MSRASIIKANIEAQELLQKQAGLNLYEAAILHALKEHGSLGLRDLRRKVTGEMRWEVPLSIVKKEVYRLKKEKKLQMKSVTGGNGYLVWVK